MNIPPTNAVAAAHVRDFGPLAGENVLEAR
jgi:hypothetical protein